MTAATVASAGPIVIISVDTHGEVHAAVALDQRGRRLCLSVSTTRDGYVAREHWTRDLGQVAAFGIEGPGSWGAGLVLHGPKWTTVLALTSKAVAEVATSS